MSKHTDAGKAAFDFVVQQIRKNPAVTYRDVAARAEKAGHRVYPIVYGNAKRVLGMARKATIASATPSKPVKTPAVGEIVAHAEKVRIAREAAMQRLRELESEHAAIVEALGATSEPLATGRSRVTNGVPRAHDDLVWSPKE